MHIRTNPRQIDINRDRRQVTDFAKIWTMGKKRVRKTYWPREFYL